MLVDNLDLLASIGIPLRFLYIRYRMFCLTLRLFEVEVSFNTPYALRQHEMKYEHKIGKRKYLEDPLKNNITRFMDIIINKTQKGLKK